MQSTERKGEKVVVHRGVHVPTPASAKGGDLPVSTGGAHGAGADASKGLQVSRETCMELTLKVLPAWPCLKCKDKCVQGTADKAQKGIDQATGKAQQGVDQAAGKAKSGINQGLDKVKTLLGMLSCQHVSSLQASIASTLLSSPVCSGC